MFDSCWVESFLTLSSFIISLTFWSFSNLIIHRDHPTKTESLLFFCNIFSICWRIWHLFTATIRDHQRAYLQETYSCHVTFTALPHCHVTYEQMQFCQKKLVGGLLLYSFSRNEKDVTGIWIGFCEFSYLFIRCLGDNIKLMSYKLVSPESANRALETAKLLFGKERDLNTTDFWPPNSACFSIQLAIRYGRPFMNHTDIRSVDELKHRLIQVQSIN